MTRLNGIPNGHYCYIIEEDTKFDDQDRIPIRLCPYWKSIKGGARCEYLGVDSKREDLYSLIWDQVKECGVNKNYIESDIE